MSLKQKGVYAMGEARAVTSDYHIVQLHVLFPALLAAPGCSAVFVFLLIPRISRPHGFGKDPPCSEFPYSIVKSWKVLVESTSSGPLIL